MRNEQPGKLQLSECTDEHFLSRKETLPIDAQEIRRLVAKGEGQLLEFKPGAIRQVSLPVRWPPLPIPMVACSLWA